MSKDWISTADTAKLIRKALKRAFPGAKFYVRSKTYSGGASIDVDWMDGPTEKEVNVVVGVFAGKSFDGMIDMGCYWSHWLLPDGSVELAGGPGTEGSRGTIRAIPETPKPHPDARKVSFGANYVFTDRGVSRELIDRVIADVCAETGWDAPKVAESSWWAGGKERGKCYGFDLAYNEDYKRMRFRDALASTSTLNAPTDDDSDDDSGATGDDYEVTYDRDWTWVRFNSKPAAAVRDALKSLGGRWSRRRKAWYIRERVSVDALASALA